MTSKLKNDPIPDEKREKLRNEYHSLPTHKKLVWLSDKATRAGMRYADFVSWLNV